MIEPDARMRRFLAGAAQRLELAKEDIRCQHRAYEGGRVDATMTGRAARDLSVAKVLTRNGEEAVCYLNGVDDALAGL